MAFPVDNTLTNLTGSFGPRTPMRLTNGKMSGGFHGGLDLAPEVPGTTLAVYATRAGTIAQVGTKKDAGHFIILWDGSHYWRYCHLSAIGVRAGQQVADGQAIGRMGASGNVTGVHLHLELYPGRQLSTRIDPKPYIWHEWNPARPAAPAAPAPAPAPAPRPKTADELYQEDWMSAQDDVNALKNAIAQLHAFVAANHLRAQLEARGHIFFDAGVDGKTPFEKAKRVARITHSGALELMASPAVGQETSWRTDRYRNTVPDRPAEANRVAMDTNTFLNKIKDHLTAFDRTKVWTRESAAEWYDARQVERDAAA